jgi:hypothetical protein
VKTQLIQLEAHDDVISVRDKMNWSKTGRVLLVWPESGRPAIHSRLDLVLLQRRSLSLGAQLALATVDPQVRDLALELGIPCFDTPREAQNAQWRTGRRRKLRYRSPKARPNPQDLWEQAHPRQPSWLEHPAARASSFLLSALALLAMAVVALPSAQIRLTPETHVQSLTVTVSASPAVSVFSLAGDLPARPITVIVEGQSLISTTGVTVVPEHQATGDVRFTNLTDRAINIPEGTIVTTVGEAITDTIRYATIRQGNLLAGAGRTLSLPVRALNPGASSNLPAQKLVAVQGALNFSLVVTNPLPIQNGRDRAFPAPRPLDYTRLYDLTLASLQQAANKQILAGLATGDVLLSELPEVQRVLDAVYTPAKASLPADQLNLNLRAEFQMLVVSGADLEALGTALLNADLPEGFEPVGGTLVIESISAPTLAADGAIRWKIRVQQTLRAQLSEAKIDSLVVGVSPDEARQRLSDWLPISEPPHITLTPDWWPRLPVTAFRIFIVQDTER